MDASDHSCSFHNLKDVLAQDTHGTLLSISKQQVYNPGFSRVPWVERDVDCAGSMNSPPQGVSIFKAADAAQSRPLSPMPSGLTSRRASHDGSVSSGAGGGGSRRATEDVAARPVIHPMPQKPLSLLRQLTGHIKVRSPMQI